MPKHNGHTRNTNNDTLNLGNCNLLLNSTTIDEQIISGKSEWQHFGDSRGWEKLYGNELVPATVSYGENKAHTNMPPYLTINMWQRIE